MFYLSTQVLHCEGTVVYIILPQEAAGLVGRSVLSQL